MADISIIARIAVRRSNLQRLNIPRLGIGALLATIFGLLGEAFKMAYVEPYTTHRRQPQVAPDDDLEGRDPMW